MRLAKSNKRKNEECMQCRRDEIRESKFSMNSKSVRFKRYKKRINKLRQSM